MEKNELYHYTIACFVFSILVMVLVLLLWDLVVSVDENKLNFDPEVQ